MKKFYPKIINGLYLIHQTYLCLLPAVVNYLIFIDAHQRGGFFPDTWSDGWVNFAGTVLFVITAFIVAAYLGVVAELKNFPTKMWKAVWVVFSIPIFLVGVLIFGNLDIFDYFVILFFTEVIGLFSLFLQIILRRFTFELKEYKKDWLSGLWIGGLFLTLFVFSVWVLFNVVHTDLTLAFVAGVLGMVVIAFLNYGRMIAGAEREQESRAVVFILVGILTWFASFFVAGILASV